LSDSYILNIANRDHPGFKYINSTIGYIKYLLEPVVINYSKIIFPEYMAQGFKNKTKEQNINTLISDIIFMSGNYVRDKLGDDTVYPLDINI